jgi:hypothetical protein
MIGFVRGLFRVVFLVCWTALIAASGFLEVAFIATVAVWAFTGEWDATIIRALYKSSCAVWEA